MIILVEFVNRETFEETGARGRYCAIVFVKLLLLYQWPELLCSLRTYRTVVARVQIAVGGSKSLSVSCPHSAVSGRSYVTQDPFALCISLRHVLKVNAQSEGL
jgi:hypothetical protein